MNVIETARALGLAQAFDRRTVGEMDVRAWQAILADADVADVLEAIQQHYAVETEWIMPAHIRRAVAEMNRKRNVSTWAPGQYGVPRDEAAPRVDGERLALSDLPAAVADLVTRVRADLPEGSREALAPRTVAWEREHRAYLRSHDGEPNPLYRPAEERECVVDGNGLCQTHNRHVSSCPASGRGTTGRAGRCDLCSADSGDLAVHVADYHPGATQ